MKAHPMLLQRKYAHVIQALALRENITRRDAMDRFYKSDTYQQMRIGLADMHCLSDNYLAEEITLEE